MAAMLDAKIEGLDHLEDPQGAKPENSLRIQHDDLTPEEEKRMIRRMDWILLPLMGELHPLIAWHGRRLMLAAGTGLQLVDKSALGSAATLTIKEDLGLTGNEYSWAVSIYYFGLLLGTYPATLLMQRYHTGKVISIAFVLWGGVMLGTAGIHNFAALAALRFLLGVFEAAMAPGFTMITSRFYTQTEQPLRFSLWTLANTIFPIPFLVIFFGLGQLSHHPLDPWRWIFILLGAITVVVGVLVWFFLPSSPDDAWWLSPAQRQYNTVRVARSQTGVRDAVFRRYQAFEALTDVKVILACGLLVFQQSGVSLQTNFSGLIIKGFGFTGLKSLLLQIPGWAVASICVVVTGYSVTHVSVLKHAKTLILAGFASVSLACIAVLYARPPTKSNQAASLVVLSLFNCNGVGYPIILSIVGQNFVGSTKKQTVLSMIFISYCVINIAIPQAFHKAPYKHGLLTVLVLMVCYVVTNITLFMIGRIENRRRNARAAAEHETDVQTIDDIQDETDQRNPRFRYAF